MDLTGVVLFVFSFVLLRYDKLAVKYICLLFLVSSFLMLPDIIMFMIRKTNENSRFGIYWLSKFFGLIIAIVIFLIGFIYSLNN